MVSLNPTSEVTEFLIITPATAPVAPASDPKTPPKAKNAPVVVITSHPEIQKTTIATKLVEFLGLKQALYVSRDVQFTWDNAGGETDLQWVVRDEDCLSQVIVITESRLGFTDGFKDAMDHLRIAKDAKRPLLPVLLTQRCKEDGKRAVHSVFTRFATLPFRSCVASQHLRQAYYAVMEPLLSTASGTGLHGHDKPPGNEQQQPLVKEETRSLASGSEKSTAQASTTWPPGRSPDSSNPPSLRHDREGRQSALKLWLPEVMLLVAAGALLAAVFAILCSQNRRLQRNWRLPITLNSLANLLSTLFRAAVVAVAAEMICQAKWTWFWSDRRSTRRMADLQHFDSGSRGLLGSLQLARTVALRSPSTLVAVFVIVSSFAVGPFVQQAIKTREGTVEVDKWAVISAAQPVAVSYWFFQAATTSNSSKVVSIDYYMRPSARIALQTALQNPRGDDSSAWFNCATGNCTFYGLESGAPIESVEAVRSCTEMTHATTGICHVSTDVSSLIARERPPRSSSDTVRMTLPNGMALNTSETASGMVFAPGDLSWAAGAISPRTQKLARHALSNITMLTTLSPGRRKFQDEPTASSCSLYLCLKGYSGIVQNGELIERLISSEPMVHNERYKGDNPYEGQGSFVAVRSPCVVNGREFTEADIAGGENLRWYEANRLCVYSVGWLLAKELGRFLDGAFSETCEWRNQLGESLRCRESFWLSEFWAQGQTEARTISDRMSWTADALTNQLRRGLGRTQGSDSNVKGRALEYATFFVIDSEWLLFPALLLLLEAALLGLMIGRSWRCRGEEAVWKSSVLPLPYYREEGEGDLRPLMTTQEMEKDAESVSVRFSRWREGYSGDGTRLRHITVRIGPIFLVSVRRASAHVSRYHAPGFNDSGTKITLSSNKMPPSIVNGSSALPKVLCLHGGGTSARIFGIQLARLTRELSAHFEFVYLDAPIKTGPGPGVLPFFEGCDPFFRWVSDDPATPAAEFQAQKDRAVALLKDFVRENGPFAGLVGFSQGARAAASLLLEEQREPFFGGRVFGLFICGTFPPFVPCEDVLIAAPTVHVIGLEDPWEPDSEELLALCAKEGPRRVVRFPEGHHLPTSKETIAQISKLVLGVYRENVASAEDQ
ncbi:hypothetical protein CMUS01_14808 [Colletotrichum musicola]|uniref:Serine hydrolase domain-containing protein n=1 Tax=Colletotrichum musicola TaxID=2175873 RepID=A0A8H6J243_9PEZI|nr:hypothetical protein CMUS01_14808 [Colletotrichum musicola]